MPKYNETDGVWRTIGGRRVFIKTGQSISDAMKESGKFNKATKVKVEGYSHKIDSDYEDRLAKYKEIQKDANKRYDKGEIDKKERNKLIDDAHDKYIKQKELSKNIVDEVNESNREYAKKKAEEYKNTKDPMFQDVKEERAKEYEKQASAKTYKASDLEEGKPYEIDMGNGIKKTAIYIGKDEDGNSSFYDGEGVSGTFGFSDKFINEKVKISDNKDDQKFQIENTKQK